MKLNEWLENKGKSAYWLASEMEVSESLVSRIRSGEKPPSAKFRLIFLETFGAEEYRLVFPQDVITESLEKSK